MSKWKQLDLSRTFERPAVGQLVALRKIPNNSGAKYYTSCEYDIGRFQKDPDSGRKLWWNGTHGTRDPIKMKKHYEIWWCVVQDFDE